jgi:hypothetical protein
MSYVLSFLLIAKMNFESSISISVRKNCLAEKPYVEILLILLQVLVQWVG